MSSKKQDDLANNPFVALFPNVECAKQYVEATSIGLAESKKLARQQSAKETPDVRKKESLPSKQVKKNLTNSKDVIVNDFLQRIFLVTVNCDEDNTGAIMFGGVPHRCIKLEQLQQELVEASQPNLLNVENLNQGLLERLQMNQPVINLCIQGAKKEKALQAVMDAKEDLLVKYLSSCFIRCSHEEMILKSKVHKEKNFVEEITQISNKCRELIVSFSGSILLQPEVFPTNNPNNQLFNAMMASLAEPILQEYVQSLIRSYANNKGDLLRIFSPLLDMIWERSQNLTLMHPDVLPLLESLTYFTKNKDLALLLINSRYWFPHSVQSSVILGISFEKDTILGKFISLSSTPKGNKSPEYFLSPSQQNEAEMQAITTNLRQQIDMVVSKLHEILYNLVQKSEIQHEVLYWFGMCLHTNSQRGKMFVDSTAASCGFFLNLTHVLLKFCEPFLEPQSKLLLKVDVRYGAVVSTVDSIKNRDTPIHLIGLNNSVMMVEKPAHMPPVTVGNAKFKFISEMFFITQRCYKLGIVKSMENYQQIMKNLQKLSSLYQDTLGAVGDIGEIKENFEKAVREQLAMKAQILNPSISELALRFSVASSYWLIQQVLSGRDYLENKHRELKAKMLPEDDIAPAIMVIPEFFPENIGDTVRFFGYFNEDVLERSQQLQYIMEFFAVFLGNANLIKNPHLRAKLAECLAVILPKDRGLESNIFSFSFRKKSFEKSAVVPKILPKSLLQLFVDIEFTGSTMEFDQKFTYRHYMYAILEHIWNIPCYYSTFKKLYEKVNAGWVQVKLPRSLQTSKKGKVAYRQDLVFTTFPRFINLLMNDSTFLLDEALQNLTMIKVLEEEKQDNKWDGLPPEERKEKETNLVQFGHMARGYNTMANETVHVLTYITRDIQRPFASPCMADGMAAFLNYFYVHLVGPKRKQLKVSDFSKYNFKPGDLVKNITQIYLSLGIEDEFLRAVVKDKRSFSLALFTSSIQVLEKLDGGPSLAADLQSKVIPRLKKWHSKLADSEKEMPEPPDEFVDPISCMLMYEPVQLPSSGQILCKSTIAKHLLSDEKDPFNRHPLRLDQVIPCKDLEARIKQWMKENNVEEPVYTADDCGG